MKGEEKKMSRYLLLEGQGERIKSRAQPMIISNDICEYGTLTCFDTDSFDVLRSFLCPHEFFEYLAISEVGYVKAAKKKAGSSIYACGRNDLKNPHRYVSLELRKELSGEGGRTACVIKKCDAGKLLLLPKQMIHSTDKDFNKSLSEIKDYYDRSGVKEKFIIEYAAHSFSLTGGVEAVLITDINYRVGDEKVKRTGKEILQLTEGAHTYFPELADILKKEGLFPGKHSIYALAAEKIAKDREGVFEKKGETPAADEKAVSYTEVMQKQKSFYF